MSDHPLILIRGAGDLGSGVAYRLYQAGYPVIMTEIPKPTLVRRAVCFGSAVFGEEGITTVEGITARVIESSSAAWLALRTEDIPIIVDTDESWRTLDSAVVIDARVAKRNIDTDIDDAQLVIALGPGFTAGENCHAVIETKRGHRLGRVIWEGSAEPDTEIPGSMQGISHQRVLRAPRDGFVRSQHTIGDLIQKNDIIAYVEDEPIVAGFTGVLRGLIHESVHVTKDLKIGDLDPRANRENCFTISDKSLAIGGGVLEAILSRGIHPMKPIERARGQTYAFP